MKKSVSLVLPCLLIFIMVLVSCVSGKGGDGGGGGTTSSSTSSTTTTTVEPEPTTEPDPFIGNEHLCDPGDTARVNFSEGNLARFTLNDGQCTTTKDNREEEYTLILYNSTATQIGFKIASPEELQPFDVTPKIVRKTGTQYGGVNQVERKSYEQYRSMMEGDSLEIPAIDRDNVVSASAASVVGDEKQYRIRCLYDDPDTACTRSAILKAVGTNVEIWADRGLLVDYYGDGTDLLTAADYTRILNVLENNIYPLQTTLLGSNCSSYAGSNCPVSDVNGDGKVAIIITPHLNSLPLTAADPEEALSPSVYVDTRNLLPRTVSNQVTNEKEVIFVVAPDPFGLFNPKNIIDKDSYIDKGLFAWLSVGLTKLISYNMHVFLNGGVPEEDWIDFGLGGLMADLAGFNIWTFRSWLWLDDPGYETIKSASEFGCPAAMAGPYLFFLYLVQSEVDDTVEATIDDGTGGALIDTDLAFLGDLMSGLDGEENLEAAISIDFDETAETEFQALFKNWTVALTTSGTNSAALQISTAFQYYFVRSSDAGMTIPDSRLYGPGIADWDGVETASTRYGADGAGAGNGDTGNANPVGMDLDNYNYTSDSSTPDYAELIENPHEFTYTPGSEFYGFVGPYTANFVRVAGLFEEETELAIATNISALKAFVVRKEDITYPKVYSESAYGALPQIPEDLDTIGPNTYWSDCCGIAKKVDYASAAGAFDTIGETVTIVGEISEPIEIDVYSQTCEDPAKQEVPDTDKYLITVPNSVGDEQLMAIWIDRQADGIDGLSTLDPMLAVVSADDVPYPTGRGIAYRQPRGLYRYLATRSAGDGTWTSEDPVNPVFQVQKECATSPLAPDYQSPASFPDGITEIGYPCFAGPVDLFDWVTLGNDGFWSYAMPDVLYHREILKPVPADPSVSFDPEVPSFDPRVRNALTLDCDLSDETDPPVNIPTQPDDWLQGGEFPQPSLFQEQILMEMSRDTADNINEDNLVVNVDSRDDDGAGKYTNFDSGNNVGGKSVENMENGLIIACDSSTDCDWINPHIIYQLHASDDWSQTIYNQPPNSPYFYMTPGNSYVIIVGGINGTKGKYELKLRKIIPDKISRWSIEVKQ